MSSSGVDAARRNGGDLPSSTRLLLVPCDATIARAATEERWRLPELLGREVDDDWPSGDLLEMLPIYADGLETHPELLRWGLYLIVERASGRVVGDIGFKGPPDEEGGVEIGYGVVPGRRGRGYATEAVDALVAWAGRRPEVREVRAFCYATNHASRRVLEKSGFSRVGGDGRLIEWSLRLPRQRR